jgi:hypothetical protein
MRRDDLQVVVNMKAGDAPTAKRYDVINFNLVPEVPVDAGERVEGINQVVICPSGGSL